MTNLNKKVLSFLIAIVIAIGCAPSIAFAQDDKESVTAFFTVSKDGNILSGHDKYETRLLTTPIKVEWFDLSEYGLQAYNRYIKDENEQSVLEKKPTLLHMLIKAVEKYYLDGEKVQNNTDAFTLVSSVYGPYFSNLWGNPDNFMFIVNHDLNTLTADQVVINNGDVVDLSLFTDYSAWNDLNWTKFDNDNYQVSKNETKSFNISKFNFSAQGDLSENMIVELLDSNNNFVEDLTDIAKTGSFEYKFKYMGDYKIVATDGDLTDSSYLVPAVTSINVKRNNYFNDPDLNSEWSDFRGNDKNNAVTTAKLPTNADETSLVWASEIGSGWDAPSQPIIVDDYLITYSAKRLIKLNKKTGEIVKEVEMAESPSYSLEPPTYSSGMIFVGLNNGTVQAFDATTLESLWIYKDELGGQPNSPITVRNGFLYTGFWKSQTDDANFVCLDITDEDKTNSLEEKSADWTYTQQGGFYWAGAYACDKFVVVGTADGADGYTSQTSGLLIFDATTGEVINEADELDGDICSTISYDKDTDKYYFVSKNGTFYSAAINAKGQIIEADSKSLKLGGMATSTPAIANGRAYVGVCGENAYTEGSGHHIAVIDLESFEVAYVAGTDGYVQSSALISTAYNEQDGYNYVYFTENKNGGSIYLLKDKKGVTSTVDGVTKTYGEKTVENCARELFTPVDEQANYGTGSLVCDLDGTIYFKNDSNFLMAVASAVKSIKVTAKPKKNSYYENEKFNKKGLKVTAEFANGTSKDVTDDVQISTDKLSIKDKDVTITYKYGIYGNRTGKIGAKIDAVSTFTDITVSHKTKVVNKVAATYFAKGYTGDTVCSICNKVIKKGKQTAKLKLKKPKFTLKKGKKLFKVTYKKVKGATGFQLKYKTGKGKWKTKKYNAKKTTTKKIKKLKSGKKYIVKIRAFVKKGNKTVYSKWAKSKKVKIK